MLRVFDAARLPRNLGWPARVLPGLVLAVALQASFAPATRASETIPLSSEFLREVPLEHYISEFTFGSEGGIWYDDDDSEIFRVTATGIPTGDFDIRFGESLGLPEGAGQVSKLTAGSDGAIWFVDYLWNDEPSEVLGRINTVGKTSEYVVDGPTGQVQGLAAGPAANIWFTVDENVGAIKRVGVTGEVEPFFPPTGNATNLPTTSRPGAITPGPDGNMWFVDNGTNDEGHNLVGRITPTGEIKEYPLPGQLQPDQWIVTGPGGFVWIGTSPSTVYRVTLEGEVTKFLVPRISGELQGLGAGPEGDIWYIVGQFAGESTLGRLTPSGEATLFEPSDASSSLMSTALGPDGELWFTTPAMEMMALKPPLAPVNVSTPVVVGESVEGEALTVSPGEWRNDAALLIRWSLCDASGSECEALVGQEGRSIPLLSFEVGHTLRAAVTASGPGGSVTAISLPSAVIRSAPVVSNQSAGSGTPGTGNSSTLGWSSTSAPTLDTTMTWEFGWSHHGTKVKSLLLQNVPPGAELEVRCRGRACPFVRRRLRPLSPTAFKKCKAGPCLSTHGGRVELSALWHGRRLLAGDVVEVAVIRNGYKGKLFPYTIRQGGPPRPPAIRCLAPGSFEQSQTC